MKDLGEPLNDHELAEAVAMLDKNKDGTIQMDEFLAWWRGKKKILINFFFFFFFSPSPSPAEHR
jgi:hypothetical protein